VRKSKAETARTREAIVSASADLIRSRGIGGTSLAEMMAAAGLTHGGFYRHFTDKEELVSEALRAAGDKVVAIIRRNLHKGGLPAAIETYLSVSHRDAQTPICPFAALGSELGRGARKSKAVATDVLGTLLTDLARARPNRKKARQQAIATLSTLVGAMTLARIVADAGLSDEILESAKDHLLE
jgi:TetR/AcrR family transcriptional repressor of nem operon